jgi:hypothetical protein
MAVAGEICVWGDARVATTLWFIYLQSREQDPVVRALLAVLDDVWTLRAGAASQPRGDRAPPSDESAKAGSSV